MTAKLLAMAGFLVLALSPSFIDFEQSPDLRYQMVLYYGIGLILIWAGFDGLTKGV